MNPYDIVVKFDLIYHSFHNVSNRVMIYHTLSSSSSQFLIEPPFSQRDATPPRGIVLRQPRELQVRPGSASRKGDVAPRDAGVAEASATTLLEKWCSPSKWQFFRRRMYENVRILGVGCFQSASIHGRVELSVDLSVVPGRRRETHLVSWLIIPIGVGCSWRYSIVTHDLLAERGES